MAIEQKRMKLNLDEVFGVLPPVPDEIELERTPDYGNISDPNWSSPVKQFSIGLQNSNNTALSNMIAKKETYGLSFFLDHIQMTQKLLFQFMLDMIDKILSKEKK